MISLFKGLLLQLVYGLPHHSVYLALLQLLHLSLVGLLPVVELVLGDSLLVVQVLLD